MSAYAAVTGGVLAIIGAALPWLTLDGGLQGYSGTIGPYGRLIVVAGALAILFGLVALRKRQRWLAPATAALGVSLLLFALWLLAGLQQVVQRPEAAMFAPARGPGLYVVLAGAILLACTSAFAGTPSGYDAQRRPHPVCGRPHTRQQ